MRKGIFNYAAYPLALGLLAGMTVGCGKKENKSSGDSPKVATLHTWVTDSSVDGGTARIKYKSTDPNAKYKCQLQAEGQAEAPWNDCPAEGASLPVEAGIRYTFKVKAIAPDGTEDKEPYSYTFVGGPAGKDSSNQPTLATLILNKDQVPETYSQTDLELQFGVDGGPSVDDVRFECKRENETSFRRCPDGTSYKFSNLKDGFMYALSVRAVLRNGGMTAAEDHVSFRVSMPGLEIGGADKLMSQTTGIINMTYPAGAECAVDGEAAIACVPTFARINLNDQQIPAGNHTMVVTVAGGGRQELSFCARTCSGTGARPAAPVVQDFQLGSFYKYTIPQGMHVVNYVTTKTVGAAADNVFWLRATEDPLSNDMDACLNNDFPHPVPGKEFSMLTPAGASMKYCATTPTRATYKAKTEGRRAFNHLEVSTDIELVTNGLQTRDERISFNVFDTDTDFMAKDTNFMSLCRNRNGRIFQTPPLRVIQRDYWREFVHASLMICLADLVEFVQDPNTGMVTPVSARWWVGSFFISSDRVQLPA
ncbi:hypothetical protein E3A20_06610, partial [Planctomyces bekefii]